MAERRGDEPISSPERQGTPTRTPGKAEGGEERSKPYPTEPGKTPGSAEGPGTADDPGTRRTPAPNEPV